MNYLSMGHLKIKNINLSLILLPRWILGIIYMYTIFLHNRFLASYTCGNAYMSIINFVPLELKSYLSHYFVAELLVALFILEYT